MDNTLALALTATVCAFYVTTTAVGLVVSMLVRAGRVD